MWRAEGSWEADLEHMGVLQAGKMGNLSFSPSDRLLPVTSRLPFWSHIVLSTENLDCGLPVLRDLPWPPMAFYPSTIAWNSGPLSTAPSHPSLHLLQIPALYPHPTKRDALCIPATGPWHMNFLPPGLPFSGIS